MSLKRELLGAAVMASVMLAGPAYAQSKTFDVPAQSVASGVAALARQADAQILLSAADAQGRNANAVRGVHTVEEALAILLAGTGLEVRATGANTFVVVDPASGNADAAEASAADDLIVTGTRIRGVENATAPGVTIDREQIDNTGYSTTRDLFASLPQNFTGGAAGAGEDSLFAVQAGITNWTGATGVNLRGLGNNSTLVLLDGRRMAPTQFGQTIDISQIPLSAVDRVDVLTEGSSAIYGSDAVGGVVNIVLRDNLDGGEFGARFGATSNDGRSERTIWGALGEVWSIGSVLASLQYQSFDSLDSRDRASTANIPSPSEVFPNIESVSGVVALEQELNANLRVFANALYSDKDYERINRTTTFAYDTVSNSENLSATAGLIVDLPGGWQLTPSFQYGRELSTMTAIQGPIANPTATRIEQDLIFESNGVELVLDGALFNLPGGEVRAALGASYRDDFFHQLSWNNGNPNFNRRVEGEVSAVFGELYVPLVGPSNRLPGVHALDVSLAYRYDDYSQFGDTGNPRVGILWEPTETLRLRASYSESFRAPNTSEQLRASLQPSVFTYLVNAPSGVGTAPALIVQGAHPLQPETASTISVGADWRPSFVEGLTLSVNRYDIEYRDRIFEPVFSLSVLQQPDVYGETVQPIADDAAAQALIDQFIAMGHTYYNFAGTGPVGVRYLADLRVLNAASVEQSGFDLSATQEVSFLGGDGAIRVSATHIEMIDTQLVAGAATSDLVDTYSYPTDWRMRADVSWRNAALSLSGALNYYGAYADNSLASAQSIDAWTTFDFVGRLQLDAFGSALLEGAELGVSVQNVFDEEPPFTPPHGPGSPNYDPANASPLGRFVALELRTRW